MIQPRSQYAATYTHAPSYIHTLQQTVPMNSQYRHQSYVPLVEGPIRVMQTPSFSGHPASIMQRPPQANSIFTFASDIHNPPLQTNFTFGPTNSINQSARATKVSTLPQQIIYNQSTEMFPKALRQTKTSRESTKNQVSTFNVDTTEFQTVKQNEFIGCFNCFNAVKYDATQRGSFC